MSDDIVYTELCGRIASAVPQLQGWCPVGKAQRLAMAVIGLNAKNLLEVGVYGGSSLIPMAMALRELDPGHEVTGRVTGVDPWSAEESIKGQGEEDAKWWGSAVDHEAIYISFYSGMHREGVSDWVRVVRAKSDDYMPDAPLDLLHLDGNHGEQALRDTQRFAPWVRVGGMVCLDDLGWSGGAVQRSAEWLIGNGFIQLYPLGTGAMFQRVEPAVEKQA